jgi:hypothetical protein
MRDYAYRNGTQHMRRYAVQERDAEDCVPYKERVASTQGTVLTVPPNAGKEWASPFPTGNTAYTALRANRHSFRRIETSKKSLSGGTSLRREARKGLKSDVCFYRPDLRHDAAVLQGEDIRGLCL